MIAVLMFPGSNCEQETKRACEKAGMQAEIVRWNEVEKLGSYSGYVLPGGWSYEDRIRAGVIASKDNVVAILKKEAAAGKPILGICNGCQILVEAGLVPGNGKLEMAVARNENPLVSGYYCSWVHMKKTSSQKGAFSDVDDIMAIPIAHGEGRFVTADKELLAALEENGQILFRYCDEGGEVASSFPDNPNGSSEAIAGICNKEGNVLAMMPHPERAAWMRQMPGEHADGEEAGPGLKIFTSMKRFIDEN